MKIIEKEMEKHLLTTMVQFNETLERFIKDEVVPAKDVHNFHNTEEVNVQKLKVQQRELPINDVERVKKQINFHIHNLKNSMKQYETAKRYELKDDMIRALSDLDIYLEKIKALNSNLLELQDP